MIDAKYVDMKKINVGVLDDEKFIDLSEIDIGFSMAEFQKILDERKRTLRALWLARAERAKSEATRWMARINNPTLRFLEGQIIDILEKWKWVERKCREYAENFK